MKCSERERDSCNVEKRGCKGCYYSIGIDYRKGESKSAISRKIEMTETEKRIKELQQYEYNKDKIEIGEYIRTDIGNILKYEGKEKKFIDEHLSISNRKDIEFLGRIVKHSKKIIDLVKIDDYVNGYRVIGILTNKVNRKKLINVGGKLFNNNDIKVIVTKEQFKAAEYKI